MKLSKLKKGFKADSEGISIEFREQLCLQSHDPLLASCLASHLGVKVYSPKEIGLSSEDCDILMNPGSGWSALTTKNKKGRDIIIHNVHHSPSRQESNIMHEVAHIICKHEFPDLEIKLGSPLPLRHYDETIEAEAEWLGGNLQITRAGLVCCLRDRMDINAIALHFNASEQMVNFRINVTGVKRQFSHLF